MDNKNRERGSSHKICNMNCCVYGCHSKKGRDRDISFHLFPKPGSIKVNFLNKLDQIEKIDRKKAWELKLKMGKPSTKIMRVCSLHFLKEDFISDKERRFPRLKKTAVPSQNLPMTKFTSKNSKSRCGRRLLQSFPQKVSTGEPQGHDELFDKRDEENELMDFDYNSLTAKEKGAVESLLSFCDIDNKSVTKKDKGIQVKSGDIVVPFILVIDSEQKLNSLTGLNSFTLLDSLVILINKYFPPKKISALTIKEKVILVLMKMKTAVTFVILSCFFKLTSKSCKRIFDDIITKLATVLKPAIYWPTSENSKQNVARCFQHFSNVRVILDCTEIPVQQAKCLCCRVMTYSNYYSKNTVKFMTGISPSGLIIYISKGYGGRASDKIIFEQSNLVELLDKGTDAIMVDKGYLIEDITSKNFIKLIRPPFLRQKNQFSREEARINAQIAKARVHIERSNQRIKLFEIFNRKLPWSLLPKIDDIFLVVCAIVNLSNSILADDKF